MRIGIRTLFIGLAALSFGGRADAQIYQWQVTDGAWSNEANWDSGLPPSDPTTQLIFGGAAGYTATNDLGAFTLNRMTFSNAGNVFIDGNALTFAGTTPTIDVQSGSAEIASVIGGSTNIVKAGAGTLTLTNANVFTAGMNISAGRVRLGNGGTTGSFGTGTIAVGAGAVLEFNRSDDMTITNLLSGTGNITVTSGIVRQSSNSSGFTGTVTINGGTFRTENLSGTHNFNATLIEVNNGGTYVFGNNTAGDPNLPNATFIRANTGGLVVWEEGEQFGGIRLFGGDMNLALGGMTLVNATASEIQSGTIFGPGVHAITGSAVINKTTGGTVTVTSVNIGNTGVFNIQEGMLSTNIGFASTGAMSLGTADNSATLRFTGETSTNTRALTVNAGGGTVEVTESLGNLTQSGALNFTGLLTKTGSGRFTVSGATSGLGGMQIDAGTANFTGPMTFAGGVQVNAGGTLLVDPNATASTSPIDVDGGTFAVNSGAGTLSFTTSTLSLVNGVVRLDLNSASLPTVPVLVINNADGLNLNGGTHTLQITNPVDFALGTFTAIDYSGAAISSGFNLVLPGRTAGTINYNTIDTRIDVTITGVDSVRWGGQINGDWDVGSALSVGGTNNWRLASNSANTNFIQSDTVTFDDTASGNFNVNIATTVLPTSVTVNNSANTYTFSGTGGIGGAVPLTKNGTGTLILATNNTYTGTTTVSQGVLQIGDGGSVGNIVSAISLAGGTTLAFNRSDAFVFTGGAIAAGGDATISQNGTGVATINSTLTLGGTTLTLSSAGNAVFNGIVTGSGSIVKTGAGTVTFTADNDGFTGAVVINGGTFAIQDTGLAGDMSPSSITVNDTGTFHFVGPDGNPDLPGTTYITANTGGTVRFSESEDFGGVTLNGGNLDLVGANANFTGTLASEFISGTITGTAGTAIGGTGAINKNTSGIVTVAGVNLNNTGGVFINDGVLETNANFGATGNLTLGADDGSTAGTLRLTNSDTATITTINKPILINDGSGTIAVAAAGKVYNLSGVINGLDGTLTKTGAGVLVLSGANTYQGRTFVNEGALVVNGSLGGGGAVSVATNAALAGTGTITGLVTNNGGTLAPGNSAGNLTLSGGLTMTSGTYLWELGALSETGAGTNFDVITITGGTATLGGTSAVDLAFIGAATNPNGGDAFWNSDRQWMILDATGATLSGNFSSIVNPGWITGNFTLSAAGSQSFLNWTFAPVPEPGTFALIAIAGAAALSVSRRRRESSIEARTEADGS